MNPLNPKKLLLTKWTTVKQLAKQKHFLVSRLLQPDDPTAPIERVEIKVMFSKTAHDESCRTTACGGRVGFELEKYFCIACHSIKPRARQRIKPP